MNKAEFIKIDFDTWKRAPYFTYYIEKIKCKYTLTHQLDITRLRELAQQKRRKFFPTFLYAIMRAVNDNCEFRMSYDEEGNLGYWNYVVPAYTIFHKDDCTFSDLWSDYAANYSVFYHEVVEDMKKYKEVKGIKVKANQPPNFCSISSIPWLSFSGFAQDTYEASDLLFPLIRFGKYYTNREKQVLIPLAVFVNHAVADGYHTSKLINDIQRYVLEADNWLT